MADQLALGVSGKLWFGDNLEVLRRYIDDESVQLIYLDPPFNSNKSYNVLFQQRDGRKAAAQVKAFDDTWRWDMAAARSFQSVIEQGGPASGALLAFREILGTSDMLAYLSMMAPRLIEMHRVLRPEGSLFLHCDPTASHYLKLLLDTTFGPKCFRNEIIWHYTGWNKRLQAHFEKRHDVILFYAKDRTAQKFNSFALPWESEEQYVKVRKQKVHYDKEGRPFVRSDAGGGKRVDRYLDEAMSYGRPVDDVWDIDKVNNSSREAQGYPTQKPLELLERIIEATTDEGDVVLDPFCGCGTSIDAAQRSNRQWIGIDITKVAIEIILDRMKQSHGDVDYLLAGEPTTTEDAEALWELDHHEFQHWISRRLGIKEQATKGADRGVDGRCRGMFDNGEVWSGVISVKGGRVNVSHVRDLRGTTERERADFGALITLKPSTKQMEREAADAGFTDEGIPRIQILTVSDLLAGETLDLPAAQARPHTQDNSSPQRRLRRVV